MKNNQIKKEINQMNKITQEVFDQLVMDALLETKLRKQLEEKMLERILLTHLSFFSNNNYLDYSELSLIEREIYCKSIYKGINLICTDSEYMIANNCVDKIGVVKQIKKLLTVLC